MKINVKGHIGTLNIMGLFCTPEGPWVGDGVFLVLFLSFVPRLRLVIAFFLVWEGLGENGENGTYLAWCYTATRSGDWESTFSGHFIMHKLYVDK